MAIPKYKPLANSSQGTKNVIKPLLIGIIGLLVVAFGLQSTSNDFDLGKLLGGSSLEESKVAVDEKGNMLFDRRGNVTTDKALGKNQTNTTAMISKHSLKHKPFSSK